jgi:hypothetical protein
MTRSNLLAAFTLLGAAALAAPVLAGNVDGGIMSRHGISDSGMRGKGGMSGPDMSRGDKAGMCGGMMQGMQGGGRDGRPNEQWRHGTPERG